ncbi:MAG: DUF2892 domain-containing protein [Acidobacteria bacterium]|nr:DUF2892 domain-containing protein [Acidobacteriota bacterium]MCA1617455.1 DUF2892 domain-containing protein [Acidobacteriota bacterium]
MSSLPSSFTRPLRAAVRKVARPVNVSSGERWLSTIAGTALAVYGISRRRFWGGALALIGAGLAWRGATGHCDIYASLGINRSEKKTTLVEETVTVNRPADELYRFWRNLENLSQVFEHVLAVTEIDRRLSRWVARAPAGATVEWDAEIVADREGEVLAWRTREDSDVLHRGSIRFRPAGEGRGTVVALSLEYEPPAGKAGVAVAKMLGEDPETQIREDLRRFKQICEAGEVPTTEGQPAGGRRNRETSRRHEKEGRQRASCPLPDQPEVSREQGRAS